MELNKIILILILLLIISSHLLWLRHFSNLCSQRNIPETPSQGHHVPEWVKQHGQGGVKNKFIFERWNAQLLPLYIYLPENGGQVLIPPHEEGRTFFALKKTVLHPNDRTKILIFGLSPKMNGFSILNPSQWIQLVLYTALPVSQLPYRTFGPV